MPRLPFPGIPRGPELHTGLGDRIPPSPQQDYQQGMDMVMRGGKGGTRTGPQFPENRMPGYGGMGTPPTGAPPNFGSILASRFGAFGR